ncbi:nuclear transport factor 2 family protein [Pseudonocardia sp. CA-107938]|uniref:nuclear transport factor 2 family protein n=1 Tax=Pseudonocardia sp. CA-107938 TaxID=3240021 RepID=UPI003D8CCCD8
MSIASAETWVRVFTDGWRAPAGAEELVNHFRPWLQPDYRFSQPLLRAGVGVEEFGERFARPLFALVPDLRVTVQDWAARDGTLFVEVLVEGTLGGRRVAMPGCDRITLQDGLAAARVSYCNPAPLLRAARPHTQVVAARCGRAPGRARPGPSMIPEDALAFVARAELATNSNDAGWPLTEVYAPDVRLEMIGDGVHQVSEGIAEAGPAVRALYDWIAAHHGRVTKTLIATSADTIVNEVEGRLFNGRHTTTGTEIWRFDEHGKVVHNVIHTALDARPPTHPAAALRALITHPHVAITYLAAQLRERRRQR